MDAIEEALRGLEKRYKKDAKRKKTEKENPHKRIFRNYLLSR